jgi:hypothetical protein
MHSSAVVALLIGCTVSILVLLLVAIRRAVVVVSILIRLLLRRTEAVSRSTVLTSIVHAILITHLLHRIAAVIFSFTGP